MTDVNAQIVGQGVAGVMKQAAAFVTAFGVCASVGWWLLQPRLEGWLEEFMQARDQATAVRLDRIEEGQNRIQRALEGFSPAAFIEFIGTGKLRMDATFRPGARVPLIYQLRRNLNCPTTIQVRFIDANTGTFDSGLTYEIPSTRAPITLEYVPFSVSVVLPDDMPPGRYAYAPLLIPQGCQGAQPVAPPISDFFTVGE